MKKHTYKKRRTKHKTPLAKLLYHLQPRSALVVITTLVVCLLLILFATNQKQTTSDAATGAAPVPSATTSSAPIVPGSSRAIPSLHQTIGIFPLASGGPIPVAANVLHPANIARVVLHNQLISIYAGSMTRTPSIGAIAILQENLTTGQQSLNIYQTSQSVGTLTILAVHNETLTFSTMNGRGTFNLITHQYHFLG